jgi:hypothetical protein
MGTTARLRPDGGEMVTFVIADLERRREWYRAAHNAAYLRAVEDLLARVRSAPKLSATPWFRR